MYRRILGKRNYRRSLISSKRPTTKQVCSNDFITNDTSLRNLNPSASPSTPPLALSNSHATYLMAASPPQYLPCSTASSSGPSPLLYHYRGTVHKRSHSPSSGPSTRLPGPASMLQAVSLSLLHRRMVDLR